MLEACFLALHVEFDRDGVQAEVAILQFISTEVASDYAGELSILRAIDGGFWIQ